MKIKLFDFELPESSIANAPARPRESAKLLHIDGDDLHDRIISDLPSIFCENDVLVFNNSKVIPARLYGLRDTVKIEILLHKQLHKQNSESATSDSNNNIWKVFARPAKRLKAGQIIKFSNSLTAEMLEKLPSGEVLLNFSLSSAEFLAELEKYGEMPLPPYIARPEGAIEDDSSDYQTCYAEHDGSVAAPTAGLHFTDSLLEKLRNNGVQFEFVTLHVGGGTFLPVKVDDTKDHIMHSEFGEISADTAQRINDARKAGKNIVAVGTTSLRLLESAARSKNSLNDDADNDDNNDNNDYELQPFCAETDIFITPSYKFKIVNRLMTNFHLPKSTLFMLVSAFAGLENMQKAYKYAIDSNYRFYSYGDACLLERRE